MLPQCTRPLLLRLPQKDPGPVAERWVLPIFLGLVSGEDELLGVFSENLLCGHPSLVSFISSSGGEWLREGTVQLPGF